MAEAVSSSPTGSMDKGGGGAPALSYAAGTSGRSTAAGEAGPAFGGAGTAGDGVGLAVVGAGAGGFWTTVSVAQPDKSQSAEAARRIRRLISSRGSTPRAA